MKNFVLSICVLLVAYTSFSQSAKSDSSFDAKEPVFEDAYTIEKWLKDHHVPTLGLGIIDHGQLKQVKVFGDIQPGFSAPYNTIFNVASLTKPVTAMVTLKLVSQGKWNLDEPVYKYWLDPDLSNAPQVKKLTTRHILTHQSGFPNWRRINPDKKLSFQFEPGTKYQYSGEGMEYLRKALEKKFHKSLEQLADELIFHPLKMQDSRYTWSNEVDSIRLAIGYDPKGNAYVPVKNKIPNAADDLLTTIEDYGRFLVSILNKERLSEKVYADMVTQQAPIKKGSAFGLGFVVYDLGNNEIALSHGGADQGVQTIFFILPKTKQGLIIFTNVDDGYSVYEKLITHYLGENGKKIVDIEMK